MDIISGHLDQFKGFLNKHGDKRVADWFMMDSPYSSAVICLVYVIFVAMGPSIMKNRQPYQLKSILLVYNFLMVVASGYIFYEFLMAGWLNDYSLSCQAVDYSNNPKALRMATVSWLFYISKFVELLDTVFFIARKKFNQVSFLHVFHHGIMPVSWWFAVKLAPGGFTTFHALLNSFIHFLMYTYYGVSALGEKYQKYLWWKKWMTKMQMIQFIVVMIHSAQLLFIEDCKYPKLFVYWIGSYALVFLAFFSNFYIQEYYIRKFGKKATEPSKTPNKIGSTNGQPRNNGKKIN